MLKAVVAFAAVIGTALSGKFAYNGESWKKEFTLVDYENLDLKKTFDDWKNDFEKKYVSIEEEYQRFDIFIQNVQQISAWNTNSNGAKLRPNQFTDLTNEEFVKYVHGKNGKCFTGNRPKHTIGRKTPKVEALRVKEDPASVDWEAAGMVTPVKNQGQCGACWAFSATGAIECQYAIAHNGELNSLSEQQLIDCSVSEGNLGCDGGEMDAAFEYVKKSHGLCSEKEYPYKAQDGRCEASTCGTIYDPIINYTDVIKKNEQDLENAVAMGCVSVAIEANQLAFQYYSSGILNGTCGTSLDHGVLVVGYGTENGQEYWKVKNSWGTTWGEQGYVLICKNCPDNGNNGECGIYDDPSYPSA
jgi:KDEL-tailed cysteine endopeptidase